MGVHVPVQKALPMHVSGGKSEDGLIEVCLSSDPMRGERVRGGSVGRSFGGGIGTGDGGALESFAIDATLGRGEYFLRAWLVANSYRLMNSEVKHSENEVTLLRPQLRHWMIIRSHRADQLA